MSSRPSPSFRSRGAWLALAAGLLGLALAAALWLERRSPPPATLRITAGPTGTSRDLVARAIAAQLGRAGVATSAVATNGDVLAALERREVDLALVSAALRLPDAPALREVAPLHVEALHLLVRQEGAQPVGEALAGLRGRRVDVGPAGSASEALARAVLAFSELDETSVAIETLEVGELERRLDAGRHDALPDAVFHLATVPSRVALRLLHEADYRLAALPFARAFRLRAVLGQASNDESPYERLELADVGEAEIPAYVYRTEPPEPPGALPTLGAPTLLLAHEAVPSPAIERLLEIVYASPLARIVHPPLDRRSLAARPALRRHEGTSDFLAHDQPLLSAGDVDELNNTLGVAGALIGGMLFLWQALRSARMARRDQLFAGHMLRVAALEQRLVELELDSEPDLDALIALQRALLELKREALDRFARGELGHHRALTELLAPVDDAREHVAALLLHVRERIEERATAEGRTVESLWREEAAPGPEPETGRG